MDRNLLIIQKEGESIGIVRNNIKIFASFLYPLQCLMMAKHCKQAKKSKKMCTKEFVKCIVGACRNYGGLGPFLGSY